MKWPWVSRGRYEEAVDRAAAFVHSASEREARYFDMLDRERERYADLLAKYHALKVQGASEPLPPTAPAPKPRPDLIKAAITRKAGRNKQLRRNMEAQVVLDRAAGMDDATIAARIDAGISGDEANVV